MNRAISAIPLLLVLVFVACGCAGKAKESANAKLNAWILGSQNDLPPGVYKVMPPDEIQVSAPQVPEINGQGGVVRPDGKVSFNVVGTVEAAGKTTDQIAADLVVLLRRYYSGEFLDVTVRVTKYNSQFIYIFGQVTQPGTQPFTGRDSLLKVLAVSKLNDNAWPEKVIVVRPSEEPGVRQKVTVDVKRMYDSGDVRGDVLLEEGDVVYVPPNPMANLSMTFGKLMIPIRPASQVATMAATGGL